jgi:membrane associated rhomboid family serine protease
MSEREPQASTRAPARWRRAVRQVALAAGLGATAGIVLGAESWEQRPLVAGLAAIVGALTGLLLLLAPRPGGEEEEEGDA